MIRAILVDDEIDALKNLKWEIERFCSDVEVLEIYTNPAEAISAINYLKPDCLFLDIEMPGMDGFGLLDRLDYRDFDLIITSAYDQYALKAFKSQASAYLLKPVDTDELKICMDRVRKNKERNVLGEDLQGILEKAHSRPSVRKIALPLSGRTRYVKIDSIIYAKADGNYTELFFQGNESEVLSKKLKDVEELLGNGPFYRSHKSYLVNTDCVVEFVFKEGNHILLENGVSIPVSRSRRKKLIELLGS